MFTREQRIAISRRVEGWRAIDQAELAAEALREGRLQDALDAIGLARSIVRHAVAADRRLTRETAQ